MQVLGRVGIDLGQQRVLGHRLVAGLGPQRDQHLGLATQPVRHGLAHHGVRLVDQEAMAGCQPVQVFIEQAAQLGQVDRHVAIGWHDDHGAALHQMVAGEQQFLFLEQIAQVVAGMAGGVQHTQRDALAQRQHIAVDQRVVGLEALVLKLGVARHLAVGRRAGGLGDSSGRW